MDIIQANKFTLAYHLNGTNLIVVRKSDYDKLQTDSQKANFYFAHEITHLAAQTIQRSEMPWWLNEASAEYVTRQAIKSTIPQTNLPYYSQYTRIAYYLAELVGKDVFIEAYFTGDLSKIRGKLIGLEGIGTFDKFMNDKSFKNKFQLIIDLCKKNNFPVENFEKEFLLWSKTKEDYVK